MELRTIFSNKKIAIILTALLFISLCITAGTSFAKYTLEKDVGSFNLSVVYGYQPYAVFCSDGSLDFCNGSYPEIGEELESGKIVQNLYLGITEANYSRGWADIASQVTSVNFVDTISPANTSYWFKDFENATSFNLANLDTSNVTTMREMFHNCKAATTLDLSGFNTEKVTTMRGLFQGCYELNTLNISNFDTAAVTTMQHMFAACHSLEELDLSHFNTLKVENMSYMFSSEQGESDLARLDLSSFETPKLKVMNHMFNNCRLLEVLDLRGFNTTKVTDMQYLFASCGNLSKVYTSDGWSEKNVANSIAVFGSCNQIKGGNGTVYHKDNLNAKYARIDGLDGKLGYFTGIVQPIIDTATLPNITWSFNGTGNFNVDSDSSIVLSGTELPEEVLLNNERTVTVDSETGVITIPQALMEEYSTVTISMAQSTASTP